MVCRQRSASMLEILPLSAASLQRQTSPDLAEFRRKVSDVPSGMYEMYILKKITFHHGDMGEGWGVLLGILLHTDAVILSCLPTKIMVWEVPTLC
uniref:Putative ovule protein n=1 Tax=Solanum chacoense TaxID=4108 RepID=A0A0V0H2I8_SOLCH